jgi:23S rRNA G2445 N2-methylase RlmL
VFIRGHKNQFSVFLDMSGAPLHQRGYRLGHHPAPLKENLAAAIIERSGWDGSWPLWDPFCGSGTLLLEAYLKISNTPSQWFRRNFFFQHIKGYEPSLWQKVRERGEAKMKARRQQPIMNSLMLLGSDISDECLRQARRSADFIGASKNGMQWLKRDATQISQIDLQNSFKLSHNLDRGIFVANPPYGLRLELEKKLLFQFSRQLKEQFSGWELWFLSGDPELTSSLRMSAKTKIPLRNGDLDCRLMHYQIGNRDEKKPSEQNQDSLDPNTPTGDV